MSAQGLAEKIAPMATLAVSEHNKSEPDKFYYFVLIVSEVLGNDTRIASSLPADADILKLIAIHGDATVGSPITMKVRK